MDERNLTITPRAMIFANKALPICSTANFV